MKKNLRTVLMSVASVLALVSCSGESNDGVSVEIANLENTKNSVSFTLIPQKAVSFGYSIFNVTENKEVMAETFDGSKARIVEVADLAESCEYAVEASATDASGKTVKSTANFTTVVSAFERKNLVMKFTATWCTNCPAMTNVLDRIAEDYGDKVIIASVHASESGAGTALEVLPQSTQLMGAFGITGLPTAVIDLYVSAPSSYPTIQAAFTKSEKNHPCVTGIGMKTTIAENELSIDAKVKFEAEGKYRIGVLVMEDGIFMEGTAGSHDGIYNHVIRAYATEPLGDYVGDVEAGVTKDFSYTIDLGDWDTSKMYAVVYISKEYSGSFHVNNAQMVKLGEEIVLPEE